MNKIKSAFPQLHCIDGNWQKEPVEEYSGMSLRDWFASKATEEDIKHHLYIRCGHRIDDIILF